MQTFRKYHCNAPESIMMEDGSCQPHDALCAACRSRECEAPENQHAMWQCAKLDDACDHCEYSKPRELDPKASDDADNETVVSLLSTIYDIRKAIGDPEGRIMLGDLAAKVREVVEERDLAERTANMASVYSNELKNRMCCTCKHWERPKNWKEWRFGGNHYNWLEAENDCPKLRIGDNGVTIYVDIYGDAWHEIESIETKGSFGCNLWEKLEDTNE